MFRKIIAWLFISAVALLSAIKFAADQLGRTTLLDDAALLWQRARPVIEFFQDQPHVWFYASLAVLAVIGIALLVPPAVWRRIIPQHLRGEPQVHPIAVSGRVLVWAYNTRPECEDGRNYPPVIRLRHFVEARNVSPKSVTLRSVKGFIRYHARNLTLPIMDQSDYQIDIHPSESVYFYVGEVFTDTIPSNTAHHEGERVERSLYDHWMASVRAHYRMFDFDDTTNLLTETVPNNGKGAGYEIVFVADNMPPRRALLFVRPFGDPTAWVAEMLTEPATNAKVAVLEGQQGALEETQH